MSRVMITRQQLTASAAALAVGGMWLAGGLQVASAQSMERTTPTPTAFMAPECRRIAKTPDIVIAAAQRALESMRELVEGRGGTVIPNRIDVVLVDDALQSEVDDTGCRRSSKRAITADTLMRLPIERLVKGAGALDRWSVRGTCTAGGRQIRCSATAIELILAKDESTSFSPTLQYVVGHEVAHIVLGHPLASLTSDAQSANASSRLAAALDVCTNEADAVAQESAADDLALKVLKQELSARGINDDRAFDGFRALYSWLLWTAGQSGRLQRGKTFCQYIRSSIDAWQLPMHHSSHPRAVARLARIAASTGVRGAYSIAQSARLEDVWVEEFCQQARAFEAKQLACDDADRAGGLTVKRTEIDGKPEVLFLRDAPSDEVVSPQDQNTLPNDVLNEVCTKYPEMCPRLREALGKCRSGQISYCNDLANALSHGFRLRDEAAVVYGYACYRNNAAACMQLATLYKVGALGPQSNGAAARKYYSKACALDSPQGCFETAVLYYEDINVPRVYTLSLLARACEGGVPRACQRHKEVMDIVQELRRTTYLPFSFLSFTEIPLR